jgi:hypothetical protein
VTEFPAQVPGQDYSVVFRSLDPANAGDVVMRFAALLVAPQRCEEANGLALEHDIGWLAVCAAGRDRSRFAAVAASAFRFRHRFTGKTLGP